MGALPVVPRPYTYLYTDVSKTKNGTGYSIVFEHSTTRDKFHQDTSILTGEFNAIKHALEATSNYHNRKFATSSDSTNAVTSILNKWTYDTAIRECKTPTSNE